MRFQEYCMRYLTLFTTLHLVASQDDHASLGYSPTFSPCPQGLKVRYSGSRVSGDQTLGPEEANYIASRRSKVIPQAYATYLSNVERYLSGTGLPNGKLPPYVSNILASKNPRILPRMSLAVAGGAYRGAIFGASMMNVFDGNNITSVNFGLGGVLQTVDYIGGLSGSAWLLVSWAQSELAPLFDLVLGSKRVGRKSSQTTGWLTEYGLLNPADGLPDDTFKGRMANRWLQTVYWTRLIRQVHSKSLAGFQVGIVDLWGRILSYHFLSGSNPDNFFDDSAPHGINETFSGLLNLRTFQNFTQPFPILTTLPGLRDDLHEGFPVPFNATRWEITPYEFGSWDPFISSFIPTSLLGTRFTAGLPVNKNKCCRNFDNAGFIMGTSSNIFPLYKFLLTFYFNLRKTLPIPTPYALTSIIPNPFLGLGKKEFIEKEDENLHLIDGGLGFEVSPYAPLLVGAREQEVILSVDGASDDKNFANGSSIVFTAQRVALYPDEYKFAKVPLNVTDFTTHGLAKRPTFFGCEETEAPLLIWIANSPPIDGSLQATLNTSTLALSIPANVTEAMLNEATTIATRGFPSNERISQGIYKDPLWPACLTCAIVDRARGRLGVAREGLCSTCFDRYCWTERNSS